MDTIRQKLSKQLEDADYGDFEFVRIDEAPVQFDENGKPFYEKKRLLTIFKRRLKSCLIYDPKNKIVDFLKTSIETLENIPEESQIFYWQIEINGNQISGRSTEKQILHIFPADEKSML